MHLVDGTERAVDYIKRLLLDRLEKNSVDFVFDKLVYSEYEENEKEMCLQVIPSDFFRKGTYGKLNSLPGKPISEYAGVPVLYGEPKVERKKGKIILYFDIIASAYFVVTRYEESIVDNRDKFGRFQGKDSILYEEGLIKRPIVEEYAELILTLFDEIGIPYKRRKEKKFNVVLTHDIDFFRKFYFKRAIKNVFSKNFNAIPLFKYFIHTLGFRKDPYDVFDKLIELEKRWKSLYFFMTDKKCQGSQGYNIRNRKVRKTIRKLISRNCEVGLHPGFNAGDDVDCFSKEKKELEKYSERVIDKVRFHYLRWKSIDMGENYQKLGIKHDYSMGFHDVAGFRLGVCHPIPMFDPLHLKETGIIEHPLIIMDNTLYSKNYMRLDYYSAYKYSLELINEVKKHNGELILLWHNTEFDESVKDKYSGKLYYELLKELS